MMVETRIVSDLPVYRGRLLRKTGGKSNLFDKK